MNLRRSLVAAGILAVALAATLTGPAGAVAHDTWMDKLEGRWTVASAERDGKPADELRGHVLTFARDTFVIHAAGGAALYRGTYRIAAGGKPAHIDFRHAEGELRGKTWLGVFALEGDRLTIVDNAGDPGKPRPSSLATGPDSGYVLLAFRRADGRR